MKPFKWHLVCLIVLSFFLNPKDGNSICSYSFFSCERSYFLTSFLGSQFCGNAEVYSCDVACWYTQSGFGGVSLVNGGSCTGGVSWWYNNSVSGSVWFDFQLEYNPFGIPGVTYTTDRYHRGFSFSFNSTSGCNGGC